MRCMDFQKFVGAFADGELDTERNLDALEHLKMCPRCTGKVDQLHAMKRALARQGRRIHAPEGLTRQIRQTLRLNGAPPARVSNETKSPRSAGRRSFLVGAAGVLLAGAVWRFWRPSDSDGRFDAPSPFVGRYVADVGLRHRACSAQDDRHQAPGLPKEPVEAGKALRRLLPLDILAPDLDRYQFDFVAADLCEIDGRATAHLIYQARSTRAYLSIFTLGADAEFDLGEPYRVADHDYFIGHFEDLNVVSWKTEHAVYACCAKWCSESLLQLTHCIHTDGELESPGCEKSP